jgi:hypothetical protein
MTINVNLSAKPVINEQKWILSGAGRSIYLVKLDGSERELLFDHVADQDCRIEVLNNSYNGKIILCKVVSKALFSYWLVDLDQNEQYPIIEGLLFRPSNSILSKDGSLVCFTTSEKDQPQIWLYEVKTKTLKEFGENVDDGLVRFVRLSYDGKFALYVKLTGVRGDYYEILCLRDFTKNRDYELTTRDDGDISIGEFYFDNQTILLTRTLPGEDYNTLWDFNISTKKFTYVMEIANEYISAISISRDGAQIALCSFNPSKPGKQFFWTMKKNGPYNLTYINDIPAGMIGLRISYDGRFLLYSTENSPTYIATVDASINEDLGNLIDLPNLKDAMWYNHPPFPPVVSATAKDNSNRVSWIPANLGTYPIQGYKVYRSLFPDKKTMTLLATVPATDNEYIDSRCSLSENYYYLVRSFDTDQTESIPSNHALLDRTPPSIQITSPESGILTNKQIIDIKGHAEDLESGIDKVMIKNTQISLDGNGYFTFPFTLSEGVNDIKATVIDRSGNTSNDIVVVTLDSIPPTLQIDFPQNKTELMATDTNARGFVSDSGSGIKIFTINNLPSPFETNGSFLVPIIILPGTNEFVFKVVDLAGNQTQKSIQINGVKKITVILTIGSDKIIVNDLPVTIDAPPFIDEKSGRTMIPARFVVEPIGGSINFEEETQKITILRETDVIELWIGKNISVVNGKQIKIDSNDESLTPRIENGRTYLPLRFVAENIGFLVFWDPILHQIKLIFPKIDLN